MLLTLFNKRSEFSVLTTIIGNLFDNNDNFKTVNPIAINLLSKLVMLKGTIRYRVCVYQECECSSVYERKR